MEGNMKIVFVTLLMMVLLVSVSCKKQTTTDIDTTKEKTDVSVIDSTQGKQSITCKAGEMFTIRLEGNPSTGFLWDFEKGFDTELAMFQGSKEETTQNEKEMVGSPVIYTWTFKALKAGSTEAIMKYKRQWEKDPVNEKTLLIQVTIIE
jgi:predicted secreted protein